MQKTLAEIAEIVHGEVVGNKDIIITGLSGIKEAKKGDLTFLSNPKYFPLAEKTNASAIIAPRNLKVPGKALIYVDNPSMAFADIAVRFYGGGLTELKGIHPSAVISPEAKIAKNVAIGPCAVIEKGVVIKENTVIHAGVFVGQESTVGANCIIYPNVTIYHRISLGSNVIVHGGTVIGSDGFGFELMDGQHQKIPQIGTVVIEDNVEIGANVTIDRARFDKTFIGKGTKIDNLVQIAHNVTIGENCIIVAQVGISGSTEIGRNVILAGQAGAVGHIKIGEGSVIAAQSGVLKSVPPNSKIMGFPARDYDHTSRIYAYVNRLPHYIEQLNALRKTVEELKKKLK